MSSATTFLPIWGRRIWAVFRNRRAARRAFAWSGHQTGISDTLGRSVGRLPGSSYTRAIAVIMPSVAAFLTPIGHHGNLLVYSPGRYRVADFVRVGTPLTVVIGVVVGLVAQRVWPG